MNLKPAPWARGRGQGDMTTQPFTVADYLLTRLKQLNVTEVFQIPGDYVKHFTQALEHFDGVKAIGAINEDLAIWKVIIVCPASMLIPWRRGNRALARSASEHRRARWEDTDRGAISKRAAARLLAALHHEKVEKKGAKYHQFFGIRFAVAEALRATRPDGGRRSA